MRICIHFTHCYLHQKVNFLVHLVFVYLCCNYAKNNEQIFLRFFYVSTVKEVRFQRALVCLLSACVYDCELIYVNRAQPKERSG